MRTPICRANIFRTINDENDTLLEEFDKYDDVFYANEQALLDILKEYANSFQL